MVIRNKHFLKIFSVAFLLIILIYTVLPHILTNQAIFSHKLRYVYSKRFEIENFNNDKLDIIKVISQPSGTYALCKYENPSGNIQLSVWIFDRFLNLAKMTWVSSLKNCGTMSEKYHTFSAELWGHHTLLFAYNDKQTPLLVTVAAQGSFDKVVPSSLILYKDEFYFEAFESEKQGNNILAYIE